MAGKVFTGTNNSCENVQERLIYLRRTLHQKWQEIQVTEFPDIPAGTLYKIMQTGQVPRKWWSTLGIKATRQPRIAISKVNMQKAAASIINNINFEKVIKLSYLLNEHINKQFKGA